MWYEFCCNTDSTFYTYLPRNTNDFHGYLNPNLIRSRKLTSNIYQNVFFLQTQNKPVHERPTWGNQIEFLMSCISTSVGLGNVWRFPFVAYQNGGGAFLIPYIIVLIVIGKPMYYLETVLGQFSNSNCVNVWGLSPAMKGQDAYLILNINICVFT